MNLWALKYLGYARSHLATLAALVSTIFIGAAFAVLQPWPLKLLVDNTLAGQPFPTDWNWILLLPGADSPPAQVAWLCAFTIAIYIGGFLIRYGGTYAQTAIGHKMIYDLGKDVFDHLQRLSPRYHAAHPTGDLVRRVTVDVGTIRDLVLNVVTPLLTSVVTLAAMFAVMWALDSSLALLALATAVPLVVVIRIFSKPMARFSHEQQQAEGNLMAVAEQTLTAIPIVQAYGREPLEDKRFRTASGKTARAYLRSIVSQLHFKTGVDGVTALGSAAIMTVGGFHVLGGDLTVGELLVLLSYLAAVYAPLQSIAYLSSGYATAAGMAHRVSEILNATDRVVEVTQTDRRVDARPRAHGAIVVDRVTFGYRPGQPVIKDVTFDGNPGETVALVGPSGGGKSTLLSLIPRLYDPWKGRVCLDGEDVRSLPLDYLRSMISVVLQEPFLLPVTIAENIAYGKPSATLREIKTAAVRSGAHDFIKRLPEGFDTIVAEGGASLSGGEKQRIAFARALLKDAPILILDEPTSSVDPVAEEIMVMGLNELMKDRTTFAIAHRLSTIRSASRILVISDGRIVDQGIHQDLVSRSGLYCDYYRKQVRANQVIAV